MMLGYKGLSDKAPYEITGPTMTRINLRLKFFNLTNRFQVSVRLFSNRSQMTSKCGKNISDTLGCASCATFLFLPHFDVICGLLPNRCMETWNLFVEHILHTVLYTFPKVLTRRICLTIKSFFSW